jgi:uncharacterized protein YgiM (DUF1202 family)
MWLKSRVPAFVLSVAMVFSGVGLGQAAVANTVSGSATEVVAGLTAKSKTMYTNTNAVVRKSGSTKAKKVKTLAKGTKVTVVAVKNGWSQISKPAKGWIRNDLLTAKKVKPVLLQSSTSKQGLINEMKRICTDGFRSNGWGVGYNCKIQHETFYWEYTSKSYVPEACWTKTANYGSIYTPNNGVLATGPHWALSGNFTSAIAKKLPQGTKWWVYECCP